MEMTEFQQATLLVGWVQAGVALFVGMVQSSLFFYGIKRMSDASERRARQTDKQIDAMMRQIDAMMRQTDLMADAFARQHEESMRRTDIFADAMAKQHEESMRRTDALLKQSEMTMKQSETTMLALQRLLKRTAD